MDLRLIIIIIIIIIIVLFIENIVGKSFLVHLIGEVVDHRFNHLAKRCP